MAQFEALEAARASENKRRGELYIVGYLKDGRAKCASLFHLLLLRKQRLMKHCVLPRRAWSQNGHVIRANLVHLKHLRMLRPMNNSERPQTKESPIFKSTQPQTVGWVPRVYSTIDH